MNRSEPSRLQTFNSIRPLPNHLRRQRNLPSRASERTYQRRPKRAQTSRSNLKHEYFSDKCTYFSWSCGTYTTRSANMKNSESTCTASNANSTPTCVASNKSGIDTAYVQGLKKPKSSNIRARSVKQPKLLKNTLNTRISEQTCTQLGFPIRNTGRTARRRTHFQLRHQNRDLFTIRKQMRYHRNLLSLLKTAPSTVHTMELHTRGNKNDVGSGRRFLKQVTE